MTTMFRFKMIVCAVSAGLLAATASQPAAAEDDNGTEFTRRVQSPLEKQPPALPPHPLESVPFRDTEYGTVPHYGFEFYPAYGHPHYDYPNERYGQWYRPRAFGLKQAERCVPRPYRPRGYGNLQNEPSTCYRVDYNPYVLADPNTHFGPSYYLRKLDGRCEGDSLIINDDCVEYHRFNVLHQLHRVGSSIKSLLTPDCH